jgi:hypothetical protein
MVVAARTVATGFLMSLSHSQMPTVWPSSSPACAMSRPISSAKVREPLRAHRRPRRACCRPRCQRRRRRGRRCPRYGPAPSCCCSSRCTRRATRGGCPKPLAMAATQRPWRRRCTRLLGALGVHLTRDADRLRRVDGQPAREWREVSSPGCSCGEQRAGPQATHAETSSLWPEKNSCVRLAGSKCTPRPAMLRERCVRASCPARALARKRCWSRRSKLHALC